MTLTAQDLVAREVHYCVSSLVSTLASNYGATDGQGSLGELTEQAWNLASPIEDWEEAAIQAGWAKDGSTWRHDDFEDAETSPENACYASEGDSAEPYQNEVYEHWIVSDWLADKLEAHGEKVDRDFAGMTVWARTTTGQAIAADGVIETILAELLAV